MSSHGGWEFTDDRGHLTVADRPPVRVVAYVQAGATLWDHGLRPMGVFGSHHDGDSPDPAKAGGLPLDGIRDFGAGSSVDPDAVVAAGPDLLVAVSYGGGQIYGIDPEAAKRLEERVPVVVVDVGRDRPLHGIRDRFTALARSLGAPREPDAQDLEWAEARLRTLTARPAAARVLALSAAGPGTVHLARPGTWPDLRALTELGVDLLDPGQGAGGNWLTTGWSRALALEPDVVLSDVRANAAMPDTLKGDRQWRALRERVRTVAWNPEAPRSHRGHARFVDAVAAAL
ncbi:ABC transporter substrate-binding protein [Streptomyces sp. NBC_00838]|uniref:ABC transporter substrate-binding protein n=1 Tax=Streptomyces sp. NBC_00838 TaxID=2903680 RepID=UPI00386B9BC3|nr:ABC transporter substrate-binding protein [Streptomyces sp. NBC_00838]